MMKKLLTLSKLPFPVPSYCLHQVLLDRHRRTRMYAHYTHTTHTSTYMPNPHRQVHTHLCTRTRARARTHTHPHPPPPPPPPPSHTLLLTHDTGDSAELAVDSTRQGSLPAVELPLVIHSTAYRPPVRPAHTCLCCRCVDGGDASRGNCAGNGTDNARACMHTRACTHVHAHTCMHTRACTCNMPIMDRCQTTPSKQVE